MNQPAKTITRGELYEAVWSKTIKTLAQEWNTTYLRLVQACQKMEVPRPSHGHWQVVARGQTIDKEPLPERTGSISNDVVLLPQGVRQEKKGAGRVMAVVAKAEVKDPEAPKLMACQELEEKKAATAATKESGQECDLPQAAERAVLNMVRQATRIDFWKEKITECIYPARLQSWLGLDEEVKIAEGRLLSVMRKFRKEYRCFQVRVEEVWDRYGQSDLSLSVEIGLREGCEWKDAWEEAWTFAEKPNPHCLSDNALRLYQWAKGSKNSGKMTDWNKIGAQAGLRKTYANLEDHLREIRLKADSSIQWGKKSKGWHGQLLIWFEKKEINFYHHGPLNPALGLDIRKIGRPELERFKKWLHDEILKPGFPDGTETVGIFDIRDRKTLKTAFNRLPDDCGSYGPLPGFFTTLRMMDGMEIRHNFREGDGPWLVVCQLQPGVTWKEIKARLTAKAKEIPLENRYALSADSRALLQWILDLRSDEYLLQMTPTVEDRLDKDIGIEAKWGTENLRAYLELLVEEINEKTEFKMRTISWHNYSVVVTRILVKKKEADLEGIVRAIQVLGLSKNKLLDGVEIRAAINGLIGER